MNNDYLPKTFEGALSHVIEECGEVLQAAGKLQRFGPLMVNPLLPVDRQETNLDALKRELKDLEGAIVRFLSLASKA